MIPLDHGTYSGWQTHKRRGVPMCEDCRDAQSRYMRNLRRVQGVGEFHWPLTVRPDLADAPCLGVALAELFRGGA